MLGAHESEQAPGGPPLAPSTVALLVDGLEAPRTTSSTETRARQQRALADDQETSKFDPPRISSRAQAESEKERREYELRFNDSTEPPQFRDRYLDVELAIRMLSRARRRRSLLCELFVYTVLVILYCLYLVGVLVRPSGFVLTETFQQAFVTKTYQDTLVYFSPNISSAIRDAQNNAFGPARAPAAFSGGRWLQSSSSAPTSAPTSASTNAQPEAMDLVASLVCAVPFFDGEGSILPEDEVDLRLPGVTYVPCVLASSPGTFASTGSFSELYSWLELLLLGSDLFPANPETLVVKPELGGGTLPRVMPDGSFVPIGAVRLRQVRVNQAPCAPSEMAGTTAAAGSRQDLAGLCSQPFSDATEFTGPFVGANGTEYSYSSAAELAVAQPVTTTGEVIKLDSAEISDPNAKYQGYLGSYPGSGYVIDVQGGSHAAAERAMAEIVAENWINSGTVALIITFTLYSSNLDLFVTQRFLVEVSPFGLIRTMQETRAFTNPPEEEEYARGMEVTLVLLSSLLILYFLYSLFSVAKRSSLAGAVFSWITYDIINLSLVLASVALSMSVRGAMRQVADAATLLMTTQRAVYSEIFWAVTGEALLLRTLSGVSLIVCFLKFFKYVDLNKRFSIALTTFVESRVRLAGWFVFAVVVISAFVCFLYFAYGWYSPQFSLFAAALESVLLFTVQVFSQPILPIQLEPGPGGAGLQVGALLKRSLSQYQLSFEVFHVGDVQFTLFPAHALVFALAFVLLVSILITNMFQAILLLGYQKVSQAVVEDENLRSEQKETLRRSRDVRNETWIQRQIKAASDLFRFKEKNLVVSRLETAPETRFRNLLSYTEVRAIIADVISSESRVDEVTFELMSLYQTRLSRIPDAVMLFQDQYIALREGRSSFQLEDDELPLVRPGGSFDPSTRDKWVRDLQSGDVVQSLFLVHCLQFERSVRRVEERLDRMNAIQGEIYRQTEQCNKAVSVLEQAERLRKGDMVEDANPWAPRPQSVVESRVDGRFDAHHVDALGKHRFLGTFATAQAAMEAIAARDSVAQPLPAGAGPAVDPQRSFSGDGVGSELGQSAWLPEGPATPSEFGSDDESDANSLPESDEGGESYRD